MSIDHSLLNRGASDGMTVIEVELEDSVVEEMERQCENALDVEMTYSLLVQHAMDCLFEEQSKLTMMDRLRMTWRRIIMKEKTLENSTQKRVIVDTFRHWREVPAFLPRQGKYIPSEGNEFIRVELHKDTVKAINHDSHQSIGTDVPVSFSDIVQEALEFYDYPPHKQEICDKGYLKDKSPEDRSVDSTIDDSVRPDSKTNQEVIREETGLEPGEINLKSKEEIWKKINPGDM